MTTAYADPGQGARLIDTRPKPWPLIGATLAVLAIAYGPMLVKFFVQQWARPHYQYFPFVIGAFAWLFWRNFSLAQPRPRSASALGHLTSIALLVAAWSLLAVAYLAESPWLAIISFLLLIAWFFRLISLDWNVNYLWGLWAMLWLLVPLPMSRDQQLINWLQHLSSRLSSMLLDWFAISHLMDGNTLVLPEKQFFVDEACSGIVSVLSIISCAVIYGIWRNRTPIHVLLLALASIGWATLMNVVRISAIAIVFAWWGLDWSSGTPHEILGLVIFLFVFLGLVSTDYLLLALLRPVVTGAGESLGEQIHYGANLVRWWDRLQAWGSPRTAAPSSKSRSSTGPIWSLPSRMVLGVVPLLLFATLAAAQLAVPLLFREAPRGVSHSSDRALALTAEVLPTSFDNLTRLGFSQEEREVDDIFGHHSRIYEYQNSNGVGLRVSCDFPFGPDWHDLTVCYRGIGWELRSLDVIPDSTNPQDPWNYVEAHFTKPDGSVGLLVYSVFDEDGVPRNPPTNSFFSDIWRSLEKKHRNSQTDKLFQIQVWTVGAGAIEDAQRDSARKLLLESRERLLHSITNTATAPLTGSTAGGPSAAP